MDIIIKEIGADRRKVMMTIASSKKFMGSHVQIGRRKTLYTGPLVRDQNMMHGITRPHTWNWLDALEELCGFLVSAKKASWSRYDWVVRWGNFEQYLQELG